MFIRSFVVSILAMAIVQGQQGFVVFEPEVTQNIPGALLIQDHVDFDQDGDLDLLVMNRHIDQWYIVRNDGPGVWSLLPGMPTLPSPLYMLAADLDSDGDPDIVMVGHGVVRILRAQGGGYLQADYNNQTFGRPPRLIDWEGDGDLDILLHKSKVMLNNGSGAFGASFWAGFPTNLYSLPLVTRDLDGDGDTDYAWISTGQGSALLEIAHQVGGSLSLTSHSIQPGTTLGPPELDAADVDGDGDLDIGIATVTAGHLDLEVWRQDAAGAFVATPRIVMPPASAASAGTYQNAPWIVSADANGDGIEDFWVMRQIIGLTSFWVDISVCLRTPSGIGQAPQAPHLILPTNRQSIAPIVDLDSDGRAELVRYSTVGQNPSPFGYFANSSV